MKKSWARGREWYRRRRLASNICMTHGCGNTKAMDRQMCRECLKKTMDYRTNRSTRLTSLGLCTRCGKNYYLEVYKDRRVKTKLCETCYLKSVSSRHFGSEIRHVDLLDILKKQDFRCAYSGNILILGENASLDHILPKVKYPEKAQDIKNVQWVISDVNKMKSDFNEERFVELITAIHRHLTRNT